MERAWRDHVVWLVVGRAAVAAAFVVGVLGVGGFGGTLVALSLSELSWRFNPAWQRTLPPPLLVLVAAVLLVAVLYPTARLQRRREDGRRSAPAWLLGLLWGAGIGLGVFAPAWLVELRIDLEAVGEEQLLEMVRVPEEFSLYAQGFQGNDVGANRYYVVPTGVVAYDAVRVPDGYVREPYERSIQEFPEGWKPFAMWWGPNPFEPGECSLNIDVSRPGLGPVDLRGIPEPARTRVRAGTMKAVYLVAYCYLRSTPTFDPGLLESPG